jgi:predicted MFS family arabinose efflux permease
MSGVSARQWQPYLICFALSAQGAVLTSLVPPLLDSRDYSVAAIGFLVAAQPLAQLVSRLPGGLLYASDRARWLLLGSLLLSVVASLLHPLADNTPAFLAVRVLAGAAIGVATTVNLALFSESMPAGRARQRAMGYYTAGFAVGYSTGSLIGGFAADWFGLVPSFGVAAALGTVSLLGVPRRRAASVASAPAEGPLRWRAVAHPRLIAVLVVCLCLFVHFSFWNAYLPLYGILVGLALADVGLIRGAFGMCQILARPASGALVGRAGAGWLIVGGLLLQAVTLLAVPAVAGLVPLLVLFVVMGTARAVAIVANAVELVDSAEEAGVPRGVMAGLFNTAQDVGQLLGPALGGLLASAYGLPTTFRLVAVLTLAVAAAGLLAAHWQPRPALAR